MVTRPFSRDKASAMEAPWRALLVIAPVLAALVLAGANSSSAPAADTKATYIVQLADPPLALYSGGIAGLAPTMPAARGATRLDPDHPDSVAYLAHLASRRAAVVGAAETALGRSVDVKLRYRAAFNGFAAEMTASEADRLARLEGVESVQRDEVRELLTDSGPEWIGAGGTWGGSATGGLPGTKGEGMVVGIIDTGINHDHPSFADVGGDGFDHPTQLRHFGVCAPLNPALCNDKLIGMYDFTGTTPFDDNLHGSHTASTVAGNVLSAAALVGPTLTYTRPISGVAPHAHVISYKACNSIPVATPVSPGCPLSSTVGAIDQATLDQVDVINFSIGGGSRNPWTDHNALSFLGARAAGVFVAASAGNAGPGATTIGSPADAPWLLTVGASTHDRNLPSRLVDMSGGDTAPPADITGKSVAAGHGPAPIVYAGAPPYNSPLCGAGAADPTTGDSATNPFPPGTFKNGEIVVCDRGTYGRVAKGRNVKAGGGGGMVLVNDAANGDSLTADLHVLPAVHISHAKGQVLKQWLSSGSGHTARITGMIEDKRPVNGDVMGSFSSRGPNPSVPNVLKPDVTAPGVDIFAAFNTPLTTLPPTAPEFGIISGTSMSSPHAAGAAALLRAVHPSWTPDQVKSALVTTGFTSLPGEGPEAHAVLKEDASTPADPFDMGGGRVELRRAATAGLVFNESPVAYLDADPSRGGDARTLNLPTLANNNCQSPCSWTRTVTSTAPATTTWRASADAPTGATLTVSPAEFTLAPGESQTLTISATTEALAPNVWRFGAVTLAENVTAPTVPPTRLPVALRVSGASADPCVIPDETVVSDPSNDQLSGVSPALDIQRLDVAGLFPRLGGVDNPNIRWTLKVRELDPDSIPRNTTWRISWTTAANRVFFVHMNTFQPSGIAFQYGEVLNGVATTQGSTDEGSFTPDGTIRITVAASKVGSPGVGDTFTAVNARTAVLVGAAGTGGTVNADTTANGTYTLKACGGPANVPDAVNDTATTTQGRPVTIDVLANDTHPQNDALAVDSITQPGHGSAAVNTDGTVTYSPNADFAGADSFVYTVRDSDGDTDTATVFVTVEPLCPTGAFSDNIEAGAPGWRVQTQTNEAGPLASPNWAVVTDLRAKSASHSWFSDATSLFLKDDRLVMPAQDLTGASRLTFWHRFRFEPGFDGGVLEVSTNGGADWADIVAAGGSFVTGGYTGTIDPGFDSPIAGRPAWTAGFVDAVNAPMSQVVVNVGALAGEDVLFRFRLATDPLGVGALPGHGWWIDDVAVSDTALPCNQAPVAENDEAMTRDGAPVTVDVLANDSDPDGDALTVTVETEPANGTAVRNDDDTITYTPNAGFEGVDNFNYTVTDPDGQTDTAMVTVTVDLNDAPTAQNDSVSTPKNTPVQIDVLGNDTDPNGDTLTVSVRTQPANGTATRNGDDTITYTPRTGFVGTDSFAYDISDGRGGTSSATVTVAVGDPAAPTACFKYEPKRPNKNSRITFDGSCSSDARTPDSRLLFQWDFQNDGTVDATGIRARHRYGAAGTFTVALRVTDEDGKSDTLHRQITVRQDNDDDDDNGPEFGGSDGGDDGGDD